MIAETDGAGATIASYAYDAEGRIHSMTGAGATYYYHTNAHGDVVAVTNAAGEVANTYRYDPWGRALEANETVPNPYRYASYRYDEATGLYYLWNRWYDAGPMRFLTRDLCPGSLGAPATANPYAYCLDNPLNLTDPDGRVAVILAVVAGVIVIAIVVGGLLLLTRSLMAQKQEDLSDPPRTEEEQLDYLARQRSRTGAAAECARVAGSAASIAEPDPADAAANLALQVHAQQVQHATESKDPGVLGRLGRSWNDFVMHTLLGNPRDPDE